MRTFPECYGCVERIANSAMEGVALDGTSLQVYLDKALAVTDQHDPMLPPPKMAKAVFDCLQTEMGIRDYFEHKKNESNRLAIGILEALRNIVRSSKDPFLEAVKIAGVGNIIDVAHVEDYDLWDEVETHARQTILGDSLDAFKQKLTEVEELLYLADNAGETVFDRVFIEQLNVPVVYAVKGGPAMNDAMLADAIAAGIDQVAEIVETGSATPGTYLPDCSPEFRERFNRAGLVLSKGQANYETLDDQGDKVFFLLRTKCPVVAREMGFPIGRLVLKQGYSN